MGSKPFRLDGVIADPSLELIRDGKISDALAAHRAYLDGTPGRLIGASHLASPNVPRWNGERVERLVVVWPFGRELAATGAGDCLMFARYLPAVRARCRHLTVLAPTAMHSLLRRGAPIDDLRPPGDVVPALRAADAYSILWLALPAALGAAYGSPLTIQALPGLMAPLVGDVRHVGLCWAASQEFGAARSIRPPRQFDALADLSGVQFHCLQAWPFVHEARPWMRRHALPSWEHTAALISQLDAVVTVDTGVAHLAASIGVPVHLVLTDYEDWRWGRQVATPWYPSMRVHRGDPVGNFVGAASTAA